MKFTKEMRMARESKNWTQVEVANMIGASPSTYLRWEKGYYDIPKEYAQKICEVLDIPFEDDEKDEEFKYKSVVMNFFNNLPLDIKMRIFRTFLLELQQMME